MNDSVSKLLKSAKENSKKLLGVLIDPDKSDYAHLEQLLKAENLGFFDLILLGGSVLEGEKNGSAIKRIRSFCDLPIVIFPGSPSQIDPAADALLLLSMVSGRNPELLIGRHVESSLALKRSGLELLPTAYMLIDGGKPTTVSYISNTLPIPADKPGITALTALASEQLGMELAYLDAGSGAIRPVGTDHIKEVRAICDIPIVVGGGIRTAKAIRERWDAGADLVIIGNQLEENPNLLQEIFSAEMPIAVG